MTDKFEEQTPGITFWFSSASRFRVPTNNKLKAKLQLECEIDDESLWDAIEKRFREGYRVSTAQDFASIVMGALQEGHKELEEQVKNLSLDLTREREKKEALERELARIRNMLGTFGQALRGGP